MRTQTVTIRAGRSISQKAARRMGLGILTLFVLGWPSIARAQGTLVPFIPQLFADANNNPCSGCKLYAYAAGTTTAQATYFNQDLDVTHVNANPVIMTSGGRPTTGYIYLSATSYKFILKSAADVTIYTVDNATAIPSSSGNVELPNQVAGESLAAGTVAYLSDGTGSKTSGRWYLANADFTYASSTATQVGMVPTAIASGASGSIRIAGHVTDLSGLTVGEDYYVSATAGSLTTTPPTNARYLGRADTTTSIAMSGGAGAVRLPDSTGAFSIALSVPTALTADRLFSLIVPDANITVPVPQDLNIADGRLTLTTQTPVTTGNVTAATTLYYTPYTGNRIALYDGSAAWNVRTFNQLSIAVPATTVTMYDVWVYDNSGTPTLELTAWLSDTARATALTKQDGVYVKTGATTRRYVGSFRTTGVSGQTEDSITKRYLYNYYHRVPRILQVVDAANSWNYTMAAYQQADANAANQVDVVVGVAESTVRLTVQSNFSNSSADVTATVNVGYDSTTVAVTSVHNSMQSDVVNRQRVVTAQVVHEPAVGRHVYVWLEASEAAGTTTWYGDNGGTLVQSGLNGWIE